VLEVRNLSVRYGAVCAVNSVSFCINPGEIVALVGANGAGKSSILKGLLGLARSTGSICLGGTDIQGLPTHQRVAAGIALSPEGRHVFPQMSVEENLELGYRDGAVPIQQAMQHMFDMFPRLMERRSQMAGSMSGGEQQMVAIARALMSGPKVLMLDEPTLGLAPIVVEGLQRTIQKLRDEGLSILLAEQNAEFALASSDRAYVLESGAMTREGQSDDLASDPAIAEAYLGM